jgi:hypothetical protein
MQRPAVYAIGLPGLPHPLITGVPLWCLSHRIEDSLPRPRRFPKDSPARIGEEFSERERALLRLTRTITQSSTVSRCRSLPKTSTTTTLQPLFCIPDRDSDCFIAVP